MEIEIGNVVRRRGGADSGPGKWHKVESIIAEAAITKCGRRLEPRTSTGGELETAPQAPISPLRDQSCKRCG